MWQHAVFAFSVAAIVAPFSYYAGIGARQLKLPQITGYLLSGMICGPYLLGILSKESVTDLSIIEGACLSIIGLAAGAEIYLPDLSRSKKQVIGITLGICIVTWGFCYAALEWVTSSFPVFPYKDPSHLIAVASLGATLMMARSPASAIAVVKEVDGKGPFCSLVMAVVVAKDIVVIILFALNLEIIRLMILPANGSESISLISLAQPVLAVLVSMTVGLLGGLVLSLVMLTPTIPILPRVLGSPSRARSLVVLVVSTATFQLAHIAGAEPLLACVTAGTLVVNRRHERADKEREELHGMLATIMSFTNVAFFGLAGASLKLTSLFTMFGGAVAVMVVRLLAIFFGSLLGCFATGTSPEYTRLFWLSMVTQAGVAMGLARLAGTRFPEWGQHFQTFMMSVILLNLLIGPPMFRYALVRVGEAKGGLLASLPSKEAPLMSIVQPTNSPNTSASNHVA